MGDRFMNFLLARGNASSRIPRTLLHSAKVRFVHYLLGADIGAWKQLIVYFWIQIF